MRPLAAFSTVFVLAFAFVGSEATRADVRVPDGSSSVVASRAGSDPERRELVALARKASGDRAARRWLRAVAAWQAEEARVLLWTTIATRPSWVCPVQGSRFTNDWGQARSGGRRHQGTDLLAAYGTAVVANVGGTVTSSSSSLGGLGYQLEGDDGTTYKGMHLASVSVRSGRVEAGDVIGAVGTSGNARGGSPHLHFEVHPGGGGAVNPYPRVASHC
ncbi:hypothetical protein BH18ACT1_BH18ACT1_03480 [soil metagenome]